MEESDLESGSSSSSDSDDDKKKKTNRYSAPHINPFDNIAISFLVLHQKTVTDRIVH